MFKKNPNINKDVGGILDFSKYVEAASINAQGVISDFLFQVVFDTCIDDGFVSDLIETRTTIYLALVSHLSVFDYCLMSSIVIKFGILA